jgi:hypothetical protein
MNIFNDMLKEKGKWSQGRVYLLWSVIAYYITLAILLAGGIDKKRDLDVTKFKIIIDALEYAMVLFAGYPFGGKFVDAFKEIRIKKDNNQNDYDGSYE